MSASYQPYGVGSPGYVQTWQRQLNNNFLVPTHNYFGPLGDMIGDSLNMDCTHGYTDQAEAVVAQKKRRKFSSGIDMNTPSHLSLDDKLCHMLDKLNNLELSQRAIESISNHVTQTSSKVEHVNMHMNIHEHFFRLLAFKSIEIEARTRRKNVIFHGLAEGKNEKCLDVLREFLWNEMGQDADDFYIGWVHRLGLVQKARQRRPDSVSRDYPLEIKNARKRLMHIHR